LPWQSADAQINSIAPDQSLKRSEPEKTRRARRSQNHPARPDINQFMLQIVADILAVALFIA